MTKKDNNVIITPNVIAAGACPELDSGSRNPMKNGYFKNIADKARNDEVFVL